MIFAIAAMSLDLMVGYCRLYSFGHAAAYGLGAYAAALILIHLQLPLPIGIVLAVAITVVVAIPIAWICTRSTGVSFAMLTLAFAQLGYAMVFRFRDITGGSDGLSGIPRPEGPFGMTWFQGKVGYYYLVLGCLVGYYAGAIAAFLERLFRFEIFDSDVYVTTRIPSELHADQVPSGRQR